MTDQLALDPQHVALLVMDYQKGVLGRFPNADHLIDRVIATVADARARGVHVGWVRVAFQNDEFDTIPDTSIMAAIATPQRRDALHIDATASQIHSRVTPQPDDIVVRKTRVGAFTTTDLDAQLRSRSIDTIVLAGLSTSGVVLSTVREAMDRDYRIVVLSDVTADPEPDVHEFLLTRIFDRYATILSSDDLATAWTWSPRREETATDVRPPQQERHRDLGD